MKYLIIYSLVIAIFIAGYFNEKGCLVVDHINAPNNFIPEDGFFYGTIFDSYSIYHKPDNPRRIKYIYYFKDLETEAYKAMNEGYRTVILINVISTSITILSVLFCLYRMMMICAHATRLRRARRGLNSTINQTASSVESVTKED